MATQPGITREVFVGGQHIIILQQPQLSSPLGHGELTLYSPSLWLPSCHYGQSLKRLFEYLISIVIGGKKKPKQNQAKLKLLVVHQGILNSSTTVVIK